LPGGAQSHKASCVGLLLGSTNYQIIRPIHDYCWLQQTGAGMSWELPVTHARRGGAVMGIRGATHLEAKPAGIKANSRSGAGKRVTVTVGFSLIFISLDAHNHIEDLLRGVGRLEALLSLAQSRVSTLNHLVNVCFVFNLQPSTSENVSYRCHCSNDMNASCKTFEALLIFNYHNHYCRLMCRVQS